MDLKSFGTSELDFEVLAIPIPDILNPLDQQIANIKWIDSDYCFWIEKEFWENKRQADWQIRVKRFDVYS